MFFFLASPLIYLGKLGILEVLPKLFTRIITTRTVKEEVLYDKTTPEHLILTEIFRSWLEVETVNEKTVEEIMALQIHKGEAEVIVKGRELQEKEKNNVIIIDDLLAREIAQEIIYQKFTQTAMSVANKELIRAICFQKYFTYYRRSYGTVGLPQVNLTEIKHLDSLPEKATCVITGLPLDFSDGSTVSCLHCDGFARKNELQKWLYQSSTCPFCKESLILEDCLVVLQRIKSKK